LAVDPPWKIIRAPSPPLALRSGKFKLKSGINVAPYGLPPFIPF
jgi:hypothetical protein